MADQTPDHIVANLGYAPTPAVQGEWTVQKALAQLPGGAPQDDPTSPIPFFHMLERLKTTKREGWRRYGIERGESIADHMYRMSLLTLLCPPPLSSRLDLSRCVKMCLVHDMAELLVGDITPVDDVPKPEKSRRESLTVDFLTQNLLRSVPGGADAGQLIRAAWQEYEDGETLESRFVHDIDKMELLLQMVEYEKRAGHRVDLEDFAYVASKMELDETKAWGEEVIAERKMFWGDRAHGKQVDGELRVVGDEGRLRQQQDSYYEKER